jgi:hypothetical protein
MRACRAAALGGGPLLAAAWLALLPVAIGGPPVQSRRGSLCHSRLARRPSPVARRELIHDAKQGTTRRNDSTVLAQSGAQRYNTTS